ncbi:hypothetical protein B0T21DRAFT_196453 [Apiosordaria backusii]|uniref:DUF7580 domain-containing protein n=1 Tax=Apiosordaria backusii TaxID=314023 RepID=A0AA40BDX0_9PEZI|nr:hypothetical protein B0T21DRAFT_196453 [Apiosordaria backusii]
MSGFEVAGILLGSVPLLISGLEHYRDGLETIEHMVRHVDFVERLVLSISTSLTLYRYSFELLLQQFMLPENLINELCQQPGSSHWRNRDLDLKLRQRLGKDYNIYFKLVERLRSRLETLRRKLKLDESFRPIQVDVSPRTGILGRLMRLRYATATGLNHRKFMRLADGIEADVKCLEQMTRGIRSLDPIRAERQAKEAARDWLAARDCAQRLFTIMASCCFQACGCGPPHVASIPLDVTDLPRVGQGETMKPRLKFLLSFDAESQQPCLPPWKWMLVEIDSMRSQPVLARKLTLPTSLIDSTRRAPVIHVTFASEKIGEDPAEYDLPSITNLCNILSQTAVDFARPIGIIPDDGWLHRLQILSPRHIPQPYACLSSMRDVLNSRGLLGTKRKYKIAASLASAVLRFHATGWLPDTWELHQVLFFQSHTGLAPTDQPYISKRFTDQTAQPSTSLTRKSPAVRNQVLWSLGIALLELCDERPILDFRTPDDSVDEGTPTVLVKLSIAERLLEDLSSRELDTFVTVVDRCIWCKFETVKTSLNDPEFLALFYKGVVDPLVALCQM